MTVAELIEQLQKFPAELPVYVYHNEMDEDFTLETVVVCNPTTSAFLNRDRPTRVVLRM